MQERPQLLIEKKSLFPGCHLLSRKAPHELQEVAKLAKHVLPIPVDEGAVLSHFFMADFLLLLPSHSRAKRQWIEV